MSNADVKTAGSKKPGWKEILRLCLSLFIVSAAAALVLSLVNTLTADTIAMRQEAVRQEAMLGVMPKADVFSDLYCMDETIDRISGAYWGTEFVGYCVEVSPYGFGGEICLMVGVNPSGTVTGVVILDHSETASLGAKADSPDFLNQFAGRSGKITVGKDGNTIQGITGATITSKAVTEGVNTAITAVINYIAEGGTIFEEGDI